MCSGKEQQADTNRRAMKRRWVLSKGEVLQVRRLCRGPSIASHRVAPELGFHHVGLVLGALEASKLGKGHGAEVGHLIGWVGLVGFGGWGRRTA